MGFEFLKNNGARRVRHYQPQPFLLEDGITQASTDEEQRNLDYELAHDQWHPATIVDQELPADWLGSPLRFIDGKDVGRTAAWLQTRKGHPIPVRVAEIGAVVIEKKQGELRRVFDTVERVVSMIIDQFPWDEVESFAIALREQDFRLLPCTPAAGPSYSFEEMRRATQNRTQNEMGRLEKQVLAMCDTLPTLVDGRLDPRAGAFDQRLSPVVGMIKTHSRNYLHPAGLRLLYEMQAGQRTPAFHIQGKLDLVSWYVRLNGLQGEMPDWGVVRLEITRQFFEQTVNKDFSYLDCLSRVVYDYRCRDTHYGRAPISIYPIQRAEESLGSLFSSQDTLIQRFYRLTNL